MTLPRFYRREDEKAVASYSFTDIAEGTGKQLYFGISSQDDSAVDYHLVSGISGVYSSQATTSRNSDGTTTMDFDSSVFNLPRTVKGTAYFAAGMGIAVATVQLQVQVKKVDAGANVTNLSSEISSVATAVTPSVMAFLEIPLTQTVIKKGEFLRLTVKLVATSLTTGVEVGHDPANAAGNWIATGTKHSTIMKFYMSFRIDL